jgi:hypothetical protein
MKKNETTKFTKKEASEALNLAVTGKIKHKDLKISEVKVVAGLIGKLNDKEFEELKKGHIPTKKLTDKEMALAKGGWIHYLLIALHLSAGASPESEHHGREDGAAARKKIFGGS